MTMSGSGVGGSIGGLPQPTVNEREQTAANEILKTGYGLAITHDTLDLAFYEVGGQIGRYPANPSRPLLPPLISTRGSTGSEESDSAGWKQALTALVNTLPSAVKSDYEYEMSLPPNQRNLNFVALDTVLTSASSAIVWLQGVSGPSMTEGVKEVQKAMNQAVPAAALGALTDFSGLVLTGATDFLDTAGANYPQQDGLRNYVRLIGKNLNQMQDLLEGSGNPQKTFTEKAVELFTKISTLTDQYNRVSTGSDLTMLGAVLSSMQLLTASTAFSEEASPLFFLGLALGNIGMNNADSAAGIIGSSLSAAMTGLTAGIAELLMPQAGLAVQKQLELAVAATIIGSMAAAIAVHNTSKNNIPEQDSADAAKAQNKADEEKTRTFTAELALTLIVHSGVVSSTLSALVDTFGLVPAQQKYLESTLNLLALTTIALASTPEGNQDSASSLFDSLQGSITKHLNSLSDLVSEQIINQTISGETAQIVGISLEQAKQALEGGNPGDFFAALFNSLAPLGTGGAQLMDDISALKNSMSNINQILNGSMNDQTNTETRISIIV